MRKIPALNGHSTPGLRVGALALAFAVLASAGCGSGSGGTAGGTSPTPTPSTRVYAGVFTPTGQLSAARLWNTSTLLPDGRVLVAGGLNTAVGSSDAGILASAELYDPASGTFTPTGDLTAPREVPTATLLPNGLVLIAGGWGSRTASRALASAELYDPASGTFTPTGDLATPRAWATATLLSDGRVLIAGGTGRSGDTLASAELYDPASGTFTPTGNLAEPRGYHTATLLPGGRVLIAGGGHDRGSPLTSAELYDPASGTFTPTGNLAAARVDHTATLLPNGRVLVAGGWKIEGGNTDGSVLASAELYDPASGTFTLTGDMTVARVYHTDTLLPGGRVLIAGGGGAVGPLASAELFQ